MNYFKKIPSLVVLIIVSAVISFAIYGAISIIATVVSVPLAKLIVFLFFMIVCVVVFNFIKPLNRSNDKDVPLKD